MTTPLTPADRLTRLFDAADRRINSRNGRVVLAQLRVAVLAIMQDAQATPTEGPR